MHYAVIWNEANSLVSLIEAGTSLNEQGENGDTPLHEAVEMNNTNLVALLLQHGANPLIKNHLGETPADIAKVFKYDAITQALTQTSIGNC